MSIEWSEPAADDLKEIAAFLQRDDPATARIVIRKVLDAVRQLADFPGLGRPGRVRGSRELVVSGLPYILPYLVQDGRVVVLRVLHTPMRRLG